MKGKAVSGIVLILLLTNGVIMGIFALLAVNPGFVVVTWAESTTPVFDYNDMLLPEDIPNNPGGSSPPGYWETSEYLIGDVAVGIIFLESNGSFDPSTENWTLAEEANVMSEITTGLKWLADQNPAADVSFIFDVHYRVPTRYEPINRPSYSNHIWINEAMNFLGYPSTGDSFKQVRDYANDLRDLLGTDWAYVMFIIDSSNDYDGRFTDGHFAFAYLGGPFLVMTYDNGGLGINEMDRLAAHESCHIFYATDEYNGLPEYSGYLGVKDVEGSGCLMDARAPWCLSHGTRGQLGWRDSDGDYIQDIIDTFPQTTLTPYTPDPTNDTVLTYVGHVKEVPYPNQNIFGSCNNVTINTITRVEFRANSGGWMSAHPTDGAFDEDEENFTFTTQKLWGGIHTIMVRGINSIGNIETVSVVDTITIFAPARVLFVGGKAVPIAKSIDNENSPVLWEWLTIITFPLIAIVYPKKRKKA